MVPTYCPNPDCLGYRVNHESAQFPDGEVTCPLCSNDLINDDLEIARDELSQRIQRTDARINRTLASRICWFLIVVASLIVVGYFGQSIDSFFELRPGTTVGAFTFAFVLAAFFYAVLTSLSNRGLKCERSVPPHNPEYIAGAGDDFFSDGGGDIGGGD